ncbi:hypothetical protein [Micromonospora sp. DT227]|uniref:hypothetical protein n=1 Tax=Micromonospora sp. DT227 TaxID=3393433 RepID=UPI003CFAB6C9
MGEQNKAAIKLGIQVAQAGKTDLRAALALAEQGVRDFPGPVLPQGRTFGWLRDTIAASIAKSAPQVAEQPAQPVAQAVAQPFVPAPAAPPVAQSAPVAEPVRPQPQAQAQPAPAPAPVAVPLPEVAKTLRIVHTVEDGTVLRGTEKGDGVNVVMGKNGQKWRWYMAGKFWYISKSRGAKADRPRINRAANALRAAGFSVEVEIDDVDPVTGQVAAPKVSQAELLRRQRAYAHAESGLLWVLTNQGGVRCGKGCGRTDLSLRTSKVVRNDETNMPMALCLDCAAPAPVAEPEPVAPEVEQVEELPQMGDLDAELRELSKELEVYRARPVFRSEVERMSVAELRALSVTNFDKAWNELVRRLEEAESRPVSEPVALPLVAGDDCSCGNGKVGTPHMARLGQACRVRAARAVEPVAEPVSQPAAPVAQPEPVAEPEEVSPVKAAALAVADYVKTYAILSGGRHTVREVRSDIHRKVTLQVNKLITNEDDQMKVSVFHNRARDEFTVTVKLSPVVDAATIVERVEGIVSGVRGVGLTDEAYSLAA